MTILFPSMNSIFRLVRFFRSFSLFVFIIVLFYGYATLPGQVAVGYDDYGTPNLYIDKSQLFYGLSIFVVVLNVAFMLLSNLLPSIPLSRLRLPNASFWAAHRNSLVRILLNWMHSFIGMTNVFVIACFIAVVWLNTTTYTQITNYGWLLITGAIILLGWAAYLPLRLGRTVALHEDE